MAKARAALGMTQEQLADGAGVARETYRRAENSPTRKPFATTRFRIARFVAEKRNERLVDGEPRWTVEKLIEELWP